MKRKHDIRRTRRQRHIYTQRERSILSSSSSKDYSGDWLVDGPRLLANHSGIICSTRGSEKDTETVDRTKHTEVQTTIVQGLKTRESAWVSACQGKQIKSAEQSIRCSGQTDRTDGGSDTVCVVSEIREQEKGNRK